MQITLGQIAELVNGRLAGDPDLIVTGAGPIDQATETQITFAEKKEGVAKLDGTHAVAAIVENDVTGAPIPLIHVPNPRLAFAKVLAYLYPPIKPDAGIHASAIVGDGCRIEKDVSICAGVVIGNAVSIGHRTVLHSNAVIGDNVSIGDDTVVYPNVTILERCRIGSRTIIHSGTVIGSDGFGFVQEDNRHYKIQQTGIVQIDDDVEIGANNTIDRAAFGKTWIQSGVKTDNLVHIAHNVTVGKNSMIIAQAGIAGSATIGQNVIVAGQAAIKDHITIGDGAIVGGKAAVGKSVPPKHVVSSAILAMPHSNWLRFNRALPKLPDMHRTISKLEKRLEQLEKIISPENESSAIKE